MICEMHEIRQLFHKLNFSYSYDIEKFINLFQMTMRYES